jgi:heat shock protein HslJ
VCSGHSGVNTYSGSYQAGPGEKFLAVPAAVTLMAGPDNATDAEGAYLSRLSRASKHRFVDGNLVLFDPAGFESLVYEKVGG